ncbi:T9SS type A sorting domain-containing protein [Altibacter sp. HG106]|uniref:T9SS type A sorting domain-containing protein n=1 Tax=Altibacter sp. HG106 TaxID=3023937 RepID=UPI002350B7F3|nr:T9SS type A sorting domain-containing protein [Altibacter sp. HG106]MDC7995503.1 T9SS type A sorting domain-containing protein [Altibacter sp. HG106]
MKKYVFIIVLLFTYSLQSQEYVPLLDQFNEWQFTTCNSGCLTDIYYTDGDTLVDGLSYKILDGYHYISRGFLLREDIATRKVYLNLFLPTANRQYLLYDFGMEVGDSIDMKNPITPFEENAGYYVLDSIVNRPLADGNLYRHFYLSPTAANTNSDERPVWVEGVGSLSIITAPGGTPNINDVGHLSCFFKEGTSFYTNLEAIPSCDPTVTFGIEEQSSGFDTVRLVMDRTSNTCGIFGLAAIRSVEVYTLEGKRKLTRQLSGEEQILVSLETYPSGLYIVRLTAQDGSKMQKKLIVH